MSAFFLIGITQVNAQCCKPVDNKAQTANTTPQEGKTLKLKITGITCASCEVQLKQALNKSGVVIESVGFTKVEAVSYFSPKLVTNEAII